MIWNILKNNAFFIKKLIVRNILIYQILFEETLMKGSNEYIKQ